MAERGAAAQRDAVAVVIEDRARERPELNTAPLEVPARLPRSFLAPLLGKLARSILGADAEPEG